MIKSTEEVLKKLKEIYGDDYDYSLVEYINAKTKIKLICKKHNSIFEQRLDHLLKKEAVGCKFCALEKRRKAFCKTKEQFLEEAKLIHGNKYDYSKVNYINNKTKVEIICKKCGRVFLQTPQKHIVRKHGCDFCGGTATKNTEQFIKESKLIHKNKYDYSLVDYINNSTNIKIICHKLDKSGKEHGVFNQLPSNHLKGCGCPKCKITSSGEDKIYSLLKENKLYFEHPKKFLDLKDKGFLSYDFFIPSINLLIEYNGKQHYKAIKYYGGIKKFHLQKHHDWLKRKYALNNNIKLLVIPYWDFKNIESILKEEIKCQLN